MKVIKTILLEKIKLLMQDNKIVIEESIKKNINRIRVFTIFQSLLHLINIIYFAFIAKAFDNNQLLWQKGLAIVHILMFIVSLGVHIIIMWAKKNERLEKISFIQYIYFVLVLIGVVAIVAFDQLVTTNITPFIIASLAAGILFYIRPRDALIIYFVIYLAFYIVLDYVNIPDNILTTNRVNGITVILIGIFVTLINWHNHYNDVIQKREIVNQKKQLESLAYFDPLTNIPNRRLLDITLEKEIENIKRFEKESCVAIIDVDHFKKINDTYGHPAGDAVLKQIANLLNENIRKTDTIARFGGEEFVILLPDTSIISAEKVTNKLRSLIELNDFNIGNETIKITASFGLSKIETENKNYYLKADKALYKAKKNGRNQVQVSV